MERSKYIDIELKFDDGTSETIEIEREIFAELVLDAFQQGKTVQEHFIDILEREIDRVENEVDVEDIIEEMDAKIDEECPNCGSILRDEWNGMVCKDCKYWFCF